MNQTSSVLIIASMSQTPRISVSVSYRIIMTTSLAGHFGQNWTLELVRRSYTWPRMHEYVHHYIKSCTVCGCNKTPRHHPYGLLKPLPVPNTCGIPFQWISLNSYRTPMDSPLSLLYRLCKQASHLYPYT